MIEMMMAADTMNELGVYPAEQRMLPECAHS